jgi:hypothetical protein
MVFSFEGSHHRIFFDKNQIKSYIKDYKNTNDSIFIKFLSDYLYKCLRVNYGWESRVNFNNADRLQYIENHKHATQYYGTWASFTSRIIAKDTYTRHKTYYTLDDDDYRKLTSENLLDLKKQLKDKITENTAISFKIPRTLDFFIKDNERLVVHYSCENVRTEVDNILNNWLNYNNLTAHKRFFKHGFDSQETSYGCICAVNTVNSLITIFSQEKNINEIVETLISTFYFTLLKKV